MLLALGAASTALDAIQSLTSPASSSSQSTGFSQAADMFGFAQDAPPAGNTTAPSATSTGFSQLSPATMSALLAAQSQSDGSTSASSTTSTSPSSALQDLFSQIDTNGDGEITKSEFENALGAGGTNLTQADSVFNQLDTNGDGTVSLSELSSALQGGKGGGHHHHAHIGGSSDGSDPTSGDGSSTDALTQALQASFSASVTNSGGTTASSSASSSSSVSATSAVSATSSYNALDQLVQRQIPLSLLNSPFGFNA
jgi:hypothetical protein